ncbi:MAG TPA: SGNH/GDSL hydrolase family protein [Sumerlaeia bacterium]|nr:SGNH/GDSL hydrolase family protein [Sumerlaeia bacterium]
MMVGGKQTTGKDRKGRRRGLDQCAFTVDSRNRCVAEPARPLPGAPYGREYFRLRAGLDNSRVRFARERQGRVAFLGGSITHNPGWRDMVMQDLERRFPETRFDFINAGIPSMGSTPGAFRLDRDVLSRGRVDLLFVEAAVNDSTNGRTDREQVRGMEGIVRHARMANPETDIVMMHFVDPGKMQVINRGQTPKVIQNHEKVAECYHVPSLDLALEVTERIRAGEFTWKDDFRDLHPSPFGQNVYARSIQRLLDAAWRKPLTKNARVRPHSLPRAPIDSKSYVQARLVDVRDAQLGEGWRFEERWKPRDGAGTRPGFVDAPMLVAEAPGATLTLSFEGTAVGVFVAAGPDAGIVEYRIDGGPFRERDLFTKWSSGLHLPWAQVLDADLDPGRHELTLRTANGKNPGSAGHAVRIAHLLVN